MTLITEGFQRIGITRSGENSLKVGGVLGAAIAGANEVLGVFIPRWSAGTTGEQHIELAVALTAGMAVIMWSLVRMREQ